MTLLMRDREKIEEGIKKEMLNDFCSQYEELWINVIFHLKKRVVFVVQL